jgi:hypothetical protein
LPTKCIPYPYLLALLSLFDHCYFS